MLLFSFTHALKEKLTSQSGTASMSIGDLALGVLYPIKVLECVDTKFSDTTKAKLLIPNLEIVQVFLPKAMKLTNRIQFFEFKPKQYFY